MKTHTIKILNMFLIFLSSISFLSFNSLFIHFIFIFCCSPSMRFTPLQRRYILMKQNIFVQTARQIRYLWALRSRQGEKRKELTIQKKKNVIYFFHSLCRKSTFISATFVYTIITVINREFVLFYSILYSSNCGSKFLRVPREGEVKGYARLSPLV